MFKALSFAFDGLGSVYIADGTEHVNLIDSTGATTLSFGGSGSGDGQFGINGARSVLVDGSGNVWATDPSNQRIQKFSAAGPIATDVAGNLYVLDSTYGVIRKFDSSRNYIRSFASQGTGDGELSNPSAIVVDASGNMYVVDAGNYRIQKFDSNGNYLLKFGSQGTADGQFTFGMPGDIAIAPSGDILVTDVIDGVSDRVQRFNSSGAFQSKFTAIVASAISPTAIAINQVTGVIYIVDYGNIILKFDSSGNYVSTLISGFHCE